jgi:hypothetical protein
MSQELEEYVRWRVEEAVEERMRWEWNSAKKRLDEAVAEALEARRQQLIKLRARMCQFCGKVYLFFFKVYQQECNKEI